MNEQELSRRLRTIREDIVRLNNAVMAMSVCNIRRYPHNFQELSLDAAVRAEKTACRLRHLVGSTGTLPTERILTNAADTQGIAISVEDGMVRIALPRLLPKWKHPRNGEFLTMPLYMSLVQYSREHPLPQFTECAVCFVHVYDEALSLGRVRDYDNLEIKHLLDIAASFLMADDSGRLCDMYHTTAYGKQDGTLLYIMQQAQLPGFILRQKSLSNFSEKQQPNLDTG
jgi:hypothetical protein